jgi:hypothetical protein
MTRPRAALPFLLLLTACSAGPEPGTKSLSAGRGLGVALTRTAVTYVGSASFCTRPGTIDAARVASATKEWREIERDVVREGSARHALLKAAMHDRILGACRKAAKTEGCDLVVRAGDIADARGLPIADLTSTVINSL